MLPLTKAEIGKYAAALVLAVALMLPATAVMAKGEAEAPAKKTLGARLSDGWLSTRLESEYFLDRKINTFDVDVKTENGIAYVYGYVPNVAERDRALQIAKNTSGVKGVVDMLRVDPNYKAKPAEKRSFEQGLDDFWISRRIKADLIASPRVTGTWIGAHTYNGFVTLRGSADNVKEKMAAEQIARSVPGVKDVKNEIFVIGS